MENLRAYLSPASLIEHQQAILCPSESHHLCRVRRAREGEVVSLLDGKGTELRAKLTDNRSKNARLEILETITHAPPAIRVSLAQALLKGKNFEDIARKAVELGVAQIFPLASEHSEIRLDRGREESKTEKWQAYLIEAIKQSGNPFLPLIHPPASVADTIAALPSDRYLLLYAGLESSEVNLSTWINDTTASEVVWFIGPEGDFSSAEYSLLKDKCAAGISLGSIILRSETAALSVLATTTHLIRERSQ